MYKKFFTLYEKAMIFDRYRDRITLDEAKEAVSDSYHLIKKHSVRVYPEYVLTLVSKHLMVSEEDLRHPDRKSERVSFARAVYYYIAKQFGNTWSAIGLYVNKGHDTAYTGAMRIENMIDSSFNGHDKNMRAQIQRLMKQCYEYAEQQREKVV